MDTAKLTSVNLTQKTRDYLEGMRQRHGFSLSYMVNLALMEHADDRGAGYYVRPPAPRGRPRIHQEKVEWEQSHAEAKSDIGRVR